MKNSNYNTDKCKSCFNNIGFYPCQYITGLYGYNLKHETYDKRDDDYCRLQQTLFLKLYETFEQTHYNNFYCRNDATSPLLKCFSYKRSYTRNINPIQYAKYCVDRKVKKCKQKQLELTFTN